MFDGFQTLSNTIKQHQTRCQTVKMFGHQCLMLFGRQTLTVKARLKGSVIRATFFVQLVPQQCCVAPKLRWFVLLAQRIILLQKVDVAFTFLQHENLLRKVVASATNHLTKMLPVLLSLKASLRRTRGKGNISD